MGRIPSCCVAILVSKLGSARQAKRSSLGGSHIPHEPQEQTLKTGIHGLPRRPSECGWLVRHACSGPQLHRPCLPSTSKYCLDNSTSYLKQSATAQAGCPLLATNQLCYYHHVVDLPASLIPGPGARHPAPQHHGLSYGKRLSPVHGRQPPSSSRPTIRLSGCFSSSSHPLAVPPREFFRVAW